MDAIIVVDMQVGLLNGEPKYDLAGINHRINLLTAMVRQRSGKVIWIRHCGKVGDRFEPHSSVKFDVRFSSCPMRKPE